MNEDDYAIVVGINDYPTLRPPIPGSPHNLAGPCTDANELYAWLTDPNRGGVPIDQALLIRSSDYPGVDGRPNADHLSGAFAWLYKLWMDGPNVQLGRRLYIYFSGHGFCVNRCDGGVFTANASPILLKHFYVSSWFSWFYENAVFEEYVLWVDACADYINLTSSPDSAHFPASNSPAQANGRQFVAFSAKYPLLAVERPMSDGITRGVFTHALLQGLNGAASEQGKITADSLARWLKGSMRGLMTADDLDNEDVSKDPDFGPIDDILLFETPPKKFVATISFDNAYAGMTARILDNSLNEVASFEIGTIVNGTAWQVELVPGFYKITVDAQDEAQLFEVGGSENHAIDFA